MNPFELLVALIAVMLGFAIYFLPSIIAGMRGHRNRAALFALNLLLGWTFIGWVVSLVWSLTAQGHGAQA